jgi:hypothetical protein
MRNLIAVIGVGVLVLLAGGGVAAAAWLQADSGGYFATSEHRFTTSTAALKTDEIEVGSKTAHATDPNPDVGELANVRIVLHGANPQARYFVGVGPKDKVEAFLKGTSYDEFATAELSPFHAVFDRKPGAAKAPSPGTQSFWVASSTGAGTQTLNWNKTHGPWSVVVMRVDGAPGVDVSASIGLRFGFLLPTGIGGLVVGALLLVFAARRAGDRRQPVVEAIESDDTDDGRVLRAT